MERDKTVNYKNSEIYTAISCLMFQQYCLSLANY